MDLLYAFLKNNDGKFHFNNFYLRTQNLDNWRAARYIKAALQLSR